MSDLKDMFKQSISDLRGKLDNLEKDLDDQDVSDESIQQKFGNFFRSMNDFGKDFRAKIDPTYTATEAEMDKVKAKVEDTVE